MHNPGNHLTIKSSMRERQDTQCQKITMADVAEMAGVTKSTVSRYFNGGYVKKATREKIQKVIEEYNYAPNTFARLKAKESNVIGVVVPTLNSKVTSRVITSIDRYLRDRNYTTLIKNSDHDIDLELLNIQKLIHLNVDGILISSIAVTEDHRDILSRHRYPLLSWLRIMRTGFLSSMMITMLENVWENISEKQVIRTLDILVFMRPMRP